MWGCQETEKGHVMNMQPRKLTGRWTLVVATFTKCGHVMCGHVTIETRDKNEARKMARDAIIEKYHFIDPGTPVRIDKVSHFL